MNPEVINSAKSLEHILLGSGLIALACLNRGVMTFDTEKGVHVISDKSLSKKIQKYFPPYKHISTSVDHICAGAGFSLITYGGVGAFQNMYQMSQEKINNISLIGIAAYIAAHLFYETLSLHSRTKHLKQKIEINDAVQCTLDLAVPLLTYYIVKN